MVVVVTGGWIMYPKIISQKENNGFWLQVQGFKLDGIFDERKDALKQRGVCVCVCGLFTTSLNARMEHLCLN